LSRDINQEARDYTQALMGTEAYSQSAADHKKIERLFGEAKPHQTNPITKNRLG
tara:strand:+ start:1206 stop:1367 length:162 start_codon:yes stop_codon:yes gene_type:complete